MSDQKQIPLNTFTDDEIEKHLLRLAGEITLLLGIDESHPKFQAIGGLIVRATERMINGTFTDGIDTNSMPIFADIIGEELDEELGPSLTIVPDVDDDDDEPDITGQLWPDGV